MGITYKEFAWLIEPERVNKNYLFGGGESLDVLAIS